MNLKSGILKLSIILMLVLVLIPIASAMDSNETFFEEYDCPDEEEVIVEYDNIREVDNTQNDASYQTDSLSESDNEDHYADYNDVPSPDCEIREYEDAVQLPEFKQDSGYVTHDIPEINVENNDFDFDIDLTCDINETSFEELTLEKICVNVQGLFCISKNDFSACNLINKSMFFNGITSDLDTHSFKRDSLKTLELKDHLLTDSTSNSYMICPENSAFSDERIVASIFKIVGDYAYSIDNSIIGDGCIFYSVNLFCFLDFCPCFDAVFCRSFFANDFHDLCWVEYTNTL